jgi:hypothetical protein
MSVVLLKEYFELCENGTCQDLLTESEKLEVRNGGMYLTGTIQRADAKNGNGRVYPRKILEREMQKYNEFISQNRALGELDHDDSNIVNLKNVSHMVTKVWWDGDDVKGKLKILNTPNGEIVKGLVNGGVTLGISSRALGSIKEERGLTIVEDDLQLICFDIVADPSTHKAFLFSVNENKNKTLSIPKTDRLSRILTDIIGE